MIDDENDFDYEVSFEDRRHPSSTSLCAEKIETWEGSPSRHPTEQEHLWYLRDSLYRMILEYKFENL